jgi:hypothetical protein
MRQRKTGTGEKHIMVKKIAVVVLGLVAVSSGVQAASNADDRASNLPYNDGWQNGDNGGAGFQPWVLTSSGAGGRFIGQTGVNQNPSFGVFSGGNGIGDSSTADRNFTGALSAGQTFSLQLGITGVYDGGGSPGNAGFVGLTLLSGSNNVFTFVFIGGGTEWQLNDGGSNFGSGIPFAANTPINFAFTYNGGNNYSISIQEGTSSFVGNNFTANSNLTNITGFRIFSERQGANENIGFNNLAVVPEPSSLALLAGPMMLGGWFAIRRRRS